MKHFFLISQLLLMANIIFGQRSYEQGELRLKLGLPYVNSFTLNPENETRKAQTGWVGLEAGFEYQLPNNRFLSLDFSLNNAAKAFGLVDIAGEFDRFMSQSINCSQNRTFDRFTLGYGVSYAFNTWDYTRTFVPDSIPPTRELVTRQSQSLGLVLNSYYRLGNTFCIGLIYRPYFFKISPAIKLDYEHIVSLDLMWRFRIKK